tara:strand:+ start:293 stop:958 length:666 start_codon:yes stop_codon:yes gene_type:complete
MAELASPYAHFQAYGIIHPVDRTTLKIVPAETIDITWTFNIGNNGSEPKWGDQYFLFSQNLGSRVNKKLVEYAPGEGKVYDFFEEEFGVSSQVLMPWGEKLIPSGPVVVVKEPTITMYDLPIHYGVPKSYILKVPGPLAGMTAQGGGLNRPLLDWWQEVARREAYSYLSLEFGYYQLDNDKNLESQILPKANLPRPWEVFASDQPTHKFERLFKVLWEEDR